MVLSRAYKSLIILPVLLWMSCNPVVIEPSEAESVSTVSTSSRLDFDTDAYSYDKSAIQLKNGTASLSPMTHIDQDSSETGFGASAPSSKLGVSWDESISSVKLDTTINNTDLNQSWAPQWDQLLGLWHFNESSWNGSAGEVIDSSGKGRHGVRVGDANTSSSAKVGGKAGTFDGNGDYVLVSTTMLAPNSLAWTGCSWFKLGNVGGLRNFLFETSGGSYAISAGIQTNGAFQPYTLMSDGSSNNCQSSTRYDDNIWHFGCGVFQGGMIKGYVDGVEVCSSGTDIGKGVSTNSNFAIGTFRDLNGRWMNGQIDEVAIWSSVLSPNEIFTIYKRQSPKYSGTFVSRVMDRGDSSSSWTHLQWITDLPYGKELPDNSTSESTSSYSGLLNSSNMSGNIGLWHLNESSWNGTANEVKDTSGNSSHGVRAGSATTVSGFLGNAGNFNGSTDYVKVAPFKVHPG